MAKTKTELSSDVLTQMGVLSTQETATADDAAVVERMYDGKLAEWRRLGMVWWPNTSRTTSEIPDEVYPTLLDLIENAVASYWSMGKSGIEKRAYERELLKDLRRLNHKPPSGEATAFSSY